VAAKVHPKTLKKSLVQNQYAARRKVNSGGPDEAAGAGRNRCREKGWPLDRCLRFSEQRNDPRGFSDGIAQKQESKSLFRIAQPSKSICDSLPPANRQEAGNKAATHGNDSRNAKPRRGVSLGEELDQGATVMSGLDAGSTSPISTAGTPAALRALVKSVASSDATEISSPPAVCGSNIIVFTSSLIPSS
jgi:hypothetical protein